MQSSPSNPPPTTRLSAEPANVARPMAPVTFVIPGDHRSGGVRVTVLMANLLIERGRVVRIVMPKPRNGLLVRLRGIARWVRSGRSTAVGWLHEFRGALESYVNLDELAYASDEVVIAVGTYMVADVRAMKKPVIKVRYNHGFPAKPDALQEAAWRGEMTTITVSNTLVPRLQEQTGGSVWGVVPNGINPKEYFVEPAVSRKGIGAIYNPHPNKAPEDLIAVLREAHVRWPDTPQYVFSTETCPKGLGHAEYTRFPSVDRARKIYNQCRVWLLTSRTEGLPGVVLEAMACGCVVITSDNDGSLEIVRHDRDALVVPRGDREAFLEQMERALLDDPLRDRLATRATARAADFTWSRAADRMEAFLADIAAAVE